LGIKERSEEMRRHIAILLMGIAVVVLWDGIDNNCNGEIGEKPACTLEITDEYPHFWSSFDGLRPPIGATITSNCGAAIDISSIQMNVSSKGGNSSKVVPEITGNGSQISVEWIPGYDFEENTKCTVIIKALDESGLSAEKKWIFLLEFNY
jgi:hypothetical protein